MSSDTIDNNNESNNVDQQLYDALHPSRYNSNFGSLEKFSKYINDFDSYNHLLLVPTLRRLLTAYELYEGFDQCIIIKEVINRIKEERRIKKII